MIIGTAGHIDHGKTTLVKALTGVDADRLPEEKARGITLDLGYAYTTLPNGERLGFVDVPGHDRLVHNMVAGATGIDFVLLVIAADDGPMPQTREHLQIVELLGLTRGAVVVTKTDMVPQPRIDAAMREVRDLLHGRSLEGAPVFALSAATGEGVAQLKACLMQAAAQHAGGIARGRFRLAVDRCFTLKGTGVIVTGTVHAGAVRPGDECTLSPPGVTVRVRGLHSQDRPAEVGRAGERCALNLSGPGFAKELVRRGQWIVAPQLHAPVGRFDVGLQLLTTEPRPLQHWTPVHVHVGAEDVPGRVSLLEADRLEPGTHGLAQLVVDRNIGVLTGDRFILRDQAASRTVGGGIVIDPFPPQRGRRSHARLQMLRDWRALDAKLALKAALEHAVHGLNLDRFTVAWNLCDADARTLWQSVPMRTIEASGTRIGFSHAAWQSLRWAMVQALQAEHERAPDMAGVGRERLRRLAAPAVTEGAYEAALEELLAEGCIASSGAWLHDPAHRVRLSAMEEVLWERTRPLLDAQPWQPPRVRDLARSLSVDESVMRRTLKAAARLGQVHPVAHDHYFTRSAVTDLAQIVRELHGGQGAAAASLRDRIGSGRKLAIHILEFFDRVGFTRRVGDRHVLRNPHLFPAPGEERGDDNRAGAAAGSGPGPGP
jgi:selenocysteine-specific elongation factor